MYYKYNVVCFLPSLYHSLPTLTRNSSMTRFPFLQSNDIISFLLLAKGASRPHLKLSNRSLSFRRWAAEECC
jgi:hypothetical protein